MDFTLNEDRNGVRYSWNIWPSTRIESSRIVVPLGTMYTPLKKIQNLPILNYEPIRCRHQSCKAVLNPYCTVDFQGKIWVCPFCFTRNSFPPAYANAISETVLPHELLPQCTTVEYTLQRKMTLPPVFLFTIDTTIIEEELESMKSALGAAIGLLPEHALVGLITFGTNVQVHELGAGDVPRSYIFQGSKEVTPQQILTMLNLPQNQNKAAYDVSHVIDRFLCPLSQCELTLSTIISELQRDPWPVNLDSRPLRCTGVAISLAVGVLEAVCANNAGRVIVFMGGPATQGPGIIVEPLLKQNIRSHHDVDKGNAKNFLKATKYYDNLAIRTSKNGHTVDVFACAIDQVGCAEMKNLIQKTGGVLVITDLFDSEIFKESLRRLLQRDEQNNLDIAFNAIIDILPSRDIKIAGAIGSCVSMSIAGPVSENPIGIGGTTTWKMCGLTPTTTMAFFFEVSGGDGGNGGGGGGGGGNKGNNPPGVGGQGGQAGNERGYLQFSTVYQHSSGVFRQRITTVCHGFVPSSQNINELAIGFDQECAAALMARVAVFKTENEESFDIMRWLDKMLIRLMSKFGQYAPNDPNSFSLFKTFTMYPQFMFHLRRSNFLQVFNNSPDETVFFRLSLNREDVNNTMVMITPSLIAYSFDAPPTPVLLDVTAVTPNRILLLDTFFHLVIFHGETIAKWRNEGYHLNPQYESLKVLLEMPKKDSEAILKDRFPYPKVVECDQGGSQARFLIAKLNPSVTHNNTDFSGGTAEVVLTDDVSLQVFMEHLKRLATEKEK